MKLTDCYGDVGPGWAAILTMLHAELETICPEYQAVQVKEKFGGLRAYITVPRSEGIHPGEVAVQTAAFALEHKYEALSNYVCEQCGKAGENKQGPTSWWRTLCETCRG